MLSTQESRLANTAFENTKSPNLEDSIMPATQQYQNIAVPNAATSAQYQCPVRQKKSISIPGHQEIPRMPRTDTKRKRPKKTVEVPLFLRKTYHMINSSDPAIVCWSKDGKSFIIKDVDIFSSKIIPEFFNHKNFKSFVRQLNFYGFCKVKNDRIRKDANLGLLEAKYCQYRHENFRKGRSDLLEEILKSKHNAVASQEEVDALKEEVKELRGCIEAMTAEIRKLSSFIGTAAATEEAKHDPNSLRKRRRIEQSASQPPSVVLQSSKPDTAVKHVAFPAGPVYKEEVYHLDELYKPITATPAKKSDRMLSFGTIGSLNEDFLDLFQDDAGSTDEEKLPEGAETNANQDRELLAKLYEICVPQKENTGFINRAA